MHWPAANTLALRQQHSHARHSDFPIGNKEAGTYALEMALVMPIYLMLIFGFTSAALLLFVYGEATYASRAAARYASFHSTATSTPCTTNTITPFVTPLMIGAGGGQLSVSTPGCGAVGSLVTVTVQVRYPVGLPYIAASGVTLTSTAAAYILQ